jgi:hypothetical protein
MAFTAVITVATGDLWTAASQNTYLRDNMAFLKTAHVDLSAVVHGLPANVNVLGNRAAAGQFIQIATGSAYESGAGAYYDIVATFPVAFTVLLGYVPVITMDGGNLEPSHGFDQSNWRSSVTAVTVHAYVPNGHTYTLRVIAIGT